MALTDYSIKQPYSRNSGTISGMGEQQTRHCPTGYVWAASQGKCVPHTFSAYRESLGYTQPTGVTQQQQQQQQPKIGSSDYAKLLAQAIDLAPQWMQNPRQTNQQLMASKDYSSGDYLGGVPQQQREIQIERELSTPQPGTQKALCESIPGAVWVQTGALPTAGYCDMSNVPASEGGTQYPGYSEGGDQTAQDIASGLGLPVPELPEGFGQFTDYGNIGDVLGYIDPSGYTGGMQGLTENVFSGQDLAALEKERLAATEADYNRMYGQAADELTERLNREAAGAGMFHSGARYDPTQGTGIIPDYLGKLESEKLTKLGQAQAAIRGERPGLLLQQHQQQMEAMRNWGELDINAKRANVDAFLGDKKLDIDKQWNEGKLTLEAFNGRMDQLVQFTDMKLSEITSQKDWMETIAKIDTVYWSMNQAERKLFNTFVMGSVFGA